MTWLICNFVRRILNQASPHHGEEKTRIGNCWNILRTGGKLGRYLNSWRWVVFPHRLVVHPIETLGRACAGIHPGKLEEVGDPAGGAGLGHLQPQNYRYNFGSWTPCTRRSCVSWTSRDANSWSLCSSSSQPQPGPGSPACHQQVLHQLLQVLSFLRFLRLHKCWSYIPPEFYILRKGLFWNQSEYVFSKVIEGKVILIKLYLVIVWVKAWQI